MGAVSVVNRIQVRFKLVDACMGNSTYLTPQVRQWSGCPAQHACIANSPQRNQCAAPCDMHCGWVLYLINDFHSGKRGHHRTVVQHWITFALFDKIYAMPSLQRARHRQNQVHGFKSFGGFSNTHTRRKCPYHRAQTRFKIPKFDFIYWFISDCVY
jgi:hypothetical protein